MNEQDQELKQDVVKMQISTGKIEKQYLEQETPWEHVHPLTKERGEDEPETVHECEGRRAVIFYISLVGKFDKRE